MTFHDLYEAYPDFNIDVATEQELLVDHDVVISELLRPIEQTARLCGMDYLPPFVVYGTLDMKAEAIGVHAAEYRRVIETLRDGTRDLLASLGQQLGLGDGLDGVRKG